MAFLTHGSIVVLRLGAQEAVDLLHRRHLDLQVGQVPHHPVQVVGGLHTHAHKRDARKRKEKKSTWADGDQETHGEGVGESEPGQAQAAGLGPDGGAGC